MPEPEPSPSPEAFIFRLPERKRWFETQTEEKKLEDKTSDERLRALCNSIFKSIGEKPLREQIPEIRAKEQRLEYALARLATTMDLPKP